MKAIDYEKESASRSNWLDLTGGTAKDSLTLLDAFALEAMGGLMHMYTNQLMGEKAVANAAYTLAEAMLAERNKRFTPPNVVKGVTGKTYG